MFPSFIHVSPALIFSVVITLLLLSGEVAAEKTIYDCNFDKDECGWVASSDYYLFNWARTSGGSPTRGTGPVKDASGSGSFMNVRVVKEKKAEKITLESPVMQSSAASGSCRIHFSYSLYKAYPVHCENSAGDSTCKSQYGQHKDYVCDPNSADEGMLSSMKKTCAKFCGFKCPQLTVTVRAGGASEQIKLPPVGFSESWNNITGDIPQKYTGQGITVKVKGTTGWDRNSYIAIDDITFTGCNFPEITTTTPTTTAPTTTSPTATPTATTPTTSSPTTTTPTTTTPTTTTKTTTGSTTKVVCVGGLSCENILCKNDSVTVYIGEDDSTASVRISNNQMAELPIGQYRFTNTAADGSNCTLDVNVLANNVSKCPERITGVASPMTDKANLDLLFGHTLHRLELPAGVYTYHTLSESANCTTEIRISDYRVRRRLNVRARYNVDCSVVRDKVSLSALLRVANANIKQITQICQSDCQVEKNRSVSLTCTNDTLQVTWPTSTMYSAEVTEIPADLRQKLRQRLGVQISVLNVFIMSQNPPVVSPRRNKYGAQADLVLTSFCLNELVYNPATDYVTNLIIQRRDVMWH